MNKITGKNYDEERSLYGIENTIVENCTFSGPADGESPLKESKNIIQEIEKNLKQDWEIDRVSKINLALFSASCAPISSNFEFTFSKRFVSLFISDGGLSRRQIKTRQ